jgi:hypothetical protein
VATDTDPCRGTAEHNVCAGNPFPPKTHTNPRTWSRFTISSHLTTICHALLLLIAHIFPVPQRKVTQCDSVRQLWESHNVQRLIAASTKRSSSIMRTIESLTGNVVVVVCTMRTRNVLFWTSSSTISTNRVVATLHYLLLSLHLYRFKR